MDLKAEKAKRLREARAKAGYEGPSAAARAFGWKSAGYAHHENETRDFGPDAALKYGRAFRVKPAWLLGMEGATPDLPEQYHSPNLDLWVNAAVEAGVWRETTDWDDDRRFTIENMPSPVAGARRLGLKVRGYSMDEAYEPGSVLDCVSIFKGGVDPQSGDRVVVERVRPDGLRELTVKEYLIEDGRHYLVPKSSKAEFKERIEIGGPDTNHVGDDRIQVIAYVVGHFTPQVLSLLERLGKIKR